MLTGYADLAFQFGLADENQAEYISNEMRTAAKLIADGKYTEADLVQSMMIVNLRDMIVDIVYNLTA